MSDLTPLRRKVFAGCRELGLDDDTRRELQLLATGKASLAEMGEGEIRQVLKALENRGFKPSKGGRRKAAPRADLRLVHVLWRRLGDAGELKRPGRDGLNTFVRSRFGESWGSVPADIDMLRDADKISAVIRALKSMMRRAGLDPERGQD